MNRTVFLDRSYCSTAGRSSVYLGVQVSFPLEDSLEGGQPGHVEDNEGTHGLPVVHTGHVAIAFLSCRSGTESESLLHLNTQIGSLFEGEMFDKPERLIFSVTEVQVKNIGV